MFDQRHSAGTVLANHQAVPYLAGQLLVLTDSVEKVAPLTGLRQNLPIGRRGA